MTEKKAKLYTFPQNRVVRPVPHEKILEQDEKLLYNNLELEVEEIGSVVLNYMQEMGIDVEYEGENHKSIIFLTDILRSIIYRKYEVDHHLHHFIEDIVTQKPLAELQEETKKKKKKLDTEDPLVYDEETEIF